MIDFHLLRVSMTRTVWATTVAMFFWCSTLASASLALPPVSQNKASRAQAEQAIRTSIFETMKAFLTGDIKTLKQRTAQRTFDLVNLVYEAAREDPDLQNELRNARITNSDEFLRYFMQGMANQFLQAAPVSPEQAARRVANDSVLSFISDSEAKILVADSEFARAKLVAKAWKIDLTDSLKKAVLKEVKNPEMRARIKSF
jgi:hypothetical protein